MMQNQFKEQSILTPWPQRADSQGTRSLGRPPRSTDELKEWDLVAEANEMAEHVKSKIEAQLAAPKRPFPRSPATEMQVEHSPENVQALQTQIAVLQRELDSARMTIWEGSSSSQQ